METVPTTASNGNPTSETTHEQLLALLGELNDKLLPLPAPKPETVSSVDMNFILPLDGLR